jgi:phosphotransferase system HPr (HPr) family protein
MRKKPSPPESKRVTRSITIANRLGLHARPAAEFVRHANSFRSEIWLITSRGKFSALSLIDVMRANLDQNAVATLEAIGPDAEAAVERLARLIPDLPDLD